MPGSRGSHRARGPRGRTLPHPTAGFLYMEKPVDRKAHLLERRLLPASWAAFMSHTMPGQVHILFRYGQHGPCDRRSAQRRTVGEAPKVVPRDKAAPGTPGAEGQHIDDNRSPPSTWDKTSQAPQQGRGALQCHGCESPIGGHTPVKSSSISVFNGHAAQW